MPFSNHIDWKIGETFYEGALSPANTRPLYELIPRVLSFYSDRRVRFLELGPGAGNACYELFLFCGKTGIDAFVSTVSYTPINPYMPMLLSGERLFDILAECPEMQILEKGLDACLWKISTNAAFAWQEKCEKRIFGTTEKPFIHFQWVGDYPSGIVFEAEKFDIVYDMHGPLHRRETLPLLDAYSRLSQTGVLFFVFNPKYPPGQIMLEGVRKKYISLFDPSDSVIVDTSAGSALVAKPQSPMAKRFGAKFPKKPQTVPARDMIEFMKWLQT
jgi:hypothetical protein